MPPIYAFRRSTSAIVLALLAGAALGCQKERIQSYRVAILDSSKSTKQATPATRGLAPTGLSRIVATIIERPEAAWIFKIVGSKVNVDATEPEWRPFLEAIAFDENNLPKWELPKSWNESPGNEFRYATLVIGNIQPPVEIAVSQLPAGQDVITNVNRWRGQLGLSPISSDAIDSSLSSITAGSSSMRLFDESGQLSGAMPGMVATEPTAANASGAESVPQATPAGSKLPFDFVPPADWEKGPTTQFTLHRFIKKDGDRAVQLAVARLPAAGQTWHDNVNMWRGELELGPLSAAEVDQQTKDVQVDGRPAKSIDLASADDQGNGSYIVSLTTDEDSWFFKLTGEAALVAETRPEFDQFLQSIHFQNQ